MQIGKQMESWNTQRVPKFSMQVELEVVFPDQSQILNAPQKYIIRITARQLAVSFSFQSCNLAKNIKFMNYACVYLCC